MHHNTFQPHARLTPPPPAARLRRRRILLAMIVLQGFLATGAAAAPAVDALASPNSPPWAATRAFPTARAYVVPARTVVLAFDAMADTSLNDSSYSREDTRYAAYWGLGHRLALEASLLVTAFGVTAPLMLNQQTLALRWAWAGWGTLWGNPAVAVGYEANNAAMPAGVLQLSAGDAWPLGLWAVNAQIKRELRGQVLAQTYSAVAALGFAWEAINLDAGAEASVQLMDAAGDRFNFTQGLFLLGPYVRWTPAPQASLVLDLGMGQQVITGSGVSAHYPVMRPKLLIVWSL